LGSQRSWTGLATIVRFNSSNTIDARNGSIYSAAIGVQYTAGATYHIRETVDVTTHTYSVFVTAPGGTEQLLAQNYSFRTEQQGVTSLDNVTAVAEAGSLTVCNVAASAGGGGQPASVQVIKPAAGEVLIAGSSYTIIWTASGAQISQVDVAFSIDDGQTWQDVATKLPGTATTFLWTVPRVKTQTARIRVTVSNSSGVLGQAETAGDFTIRKFRASS